MFMPVNDEYRIEADSRTWMVAKVKRLKTGDTFTPITYHPSLESANESLFDRLIRSGVEPQVASKWLQRSRERAKEIREAMA